MKVSVHCPVGNVAPGEFQTMAAVREMAAAAETAGFDSVYVTDHPIPDADWLRTPFGHDTLDPFTALAFIAAASEKLKLFTQILVLPYRNPFITAKAAATLQVLSGGRLIMGIGSGYQQVEFEALGIDFHRRGALTNEALETIRLAWAGGAVTKAGSTFNAVNVEARPAPDPMPPIWIGGGSDKAVERAARWGDGWVPVFTAPGLSKINRDAGLTSVAHLAEKLARLADLRADLGKTGPFDICVGPRQQPTTCTRSEADRYLEALGELAAVGVTWTSFQPPEGSRSHWLDMIQWFGEDVIKRL